MADNFARNKRSLRENSSLLKQAREDLKGWENFKEGSLASRRKKIEYYKSGIDYLKRERIYIKSQKRLKKTGQSEISFSSVKNNWDYSKTMSVVTKAPTYVNKNKKARFQVKVTSKKRIAYFPTISDWDYNKNYKIFNR